MSMPLEIRRTQQVTRGMGHDAIAEPLREGTARLRRREEVLPSSSERVDYTCSL